MEVLHQSFTPKITVSHYDNGTKKYSEDAYLIFGAGATNNQNLLSYNYERSIDNFAGSFSFSYKESTDRNIEPVMDKFQMLDIVKIYEFDKPVFIGILTDVSFAAQSGTVQKRVTISGKSAEYLFEILQISLDVAALSAAGKGKTEGLNLTFITEVNKKDSDGTKQTTIKDGIKNAYDSFLKTLEQYKDISSVQIREMIKNVFGSDDISTYLECEKIEFLYPISSQLYQNKTVKFFDFVRNLLPSPVYEIFGEIGDNDKPKIRIRECPFDKKVWSKLPCYTISPVLLTSYSFSKSCTEVYTVFLSYLEGSLLSPDYFKKINASDKGYTAAGECKEKIAVYGFRPMEVTFVGFCNGETEDEKKAANDNLNSNIADLNNRLAEWFGHFDEMMQGNISIVNVEQRNTRKSRIGERIRLGSNEFYVKSEKHEWAYETAPTISYSVDRGGRYSLEGVFSPCKNISKFLGEFETL